MKHPAMALPNRLAWARDAACDGVDLDVFFDERRPERALAYCHTCPVRTRCLDLAFAAEGGANSAYRHGIYGGLTSKQRLQLARKETP